MQVDRRWDNLTICSSMQLIVFDLIISILRECLGTIQYTELIETTPVFGLEFSKESQGRVGRSRQTNCDQYYVSSLKIYCNFCRYLLKHSFPVHRFQSRLVAFLNYSCSGSGFERSFMAIPSTRPR